MKVIYNNKEVANNTKNYNELLNKPLLNSHELAGNTTLGDINVYSKDEIDAMVSVLPTGNIGSATQPVYVNNGITTPTTWELKSTVNGGTANSLAYYSGANAISPYSSNVGQNTADAIKPIYMNAGVPSTFSVSSGTNIKPVYVDNGTIKPLSGTVGGVTRPIYLNAGVPTSVNQWNSNDNYINFLPFVSSDGSMRVGKYIRMHDNTNVEDDYALISYNTTGKYIGLWNNQYNEVQKGAILTEGSLDNNTIKADSTTHKVSVSGGWPEVIVASGTNNSITEKYNNPTSKGHNYNIWYAYGGMQVRQQAENVYKIKHTWDSYRATAAGNGGFILNAAQNVQAYFDILGGIAYDGTIIEPQRLTPAWSSGRWESATSTNSNMVTYIIGSSTKSLHYSIEWTRTGTLTIDSTTRYAWNGFMEYSNPDTQCRFTVVITCALENEAQAPILWFSGWSNKGEQINAITEVYRMD